MWLGFMFFVKLVQMLSSFSFVLYICMCFLSCSALIFQGNRTKMIMLKSAVNQHQIQIIEAWKINLFPRKKRAGCSVLFRKTTRSGWAVTLPPAPTLPDTGRKMAALLVLLFSIGALLYSSNAQENYNKLSETYKKGVDLALENLNSRAGIQHHFLFFRSLLQKDDQVLYSMSFFLLSVFIFVCAVAHY